jgi:hypothetical protein
MNADSIWSIVVLVAILIAVFALLLWISLRVRKKGGSLTTIAMGATDEFLSRDQSRAVEEIVEQNAGKKLEQQGTNRPAE